MTKVIQIFLPEFIGMSGFSVGVTDLWRDTILNNSGVAQELINYSGDHFYMNVSDEFVGFYQVDLYHNNNYIGQGSVKFGQTSGYYIVDDPTVPDGDLTDVTKFPIETGTIEFDQEYATKSAIDSLQIKINQIIDSLQ